MAIRVGIDLVSPEEVRDAIRRHGRRYLTRIYTDEELLDCGTDARALAGRFAAKEATIKALGEDGAAIPWRSISVRRAPDGALSLGLTGAAAAVAERRGVANLSLSLAHRRSLAAAIVLAAVSS
jgi:holo-[acyl-carrier protein] synthase